MLIAKQYICIVAAIRTPPCQILYLSEYLSSHARATSLLPFHRLEVAYFPIDCFLRYRRKHFRISVIIPLLYFWVTVFHQKHLLHFPVLFVYSTYSPHLLLFRFHQQNVQTLDNLGKNIIVWSTIETFIINDYIITAAEWTRL